MDRQVHGISLIIRTTTGMKLRACQSEVADFGHASTEGPHNTAPGADYCGRYARRSGFRM